MIQTILMDVDDTLLDFARSEAAALELTLRQYGLPPEAATRYHEINTGYWRLFEMGGIEKEVLLVRRFAELFSHYGLEADWQVVNAQYLEALGGFAFLLPGAETLCRTLYSRYTLCVATNGTRKAQESRMALSGLDQYFSHAFISETIGFPKPAKGFFDAVFSALDNPHPSTVIILGDSLTSDMRGGRAAGIHTCWFNPKGLSPTADCDRIISDLSQFPAVVEAL